MNTKMKVIRLFRLLFILSTFTLVSCETTSKQSGEPKRQNFDSSIPRAVTIEKPHRSQVIKNQSFPKITYTAPAGNYVLDEITSSKNSVFYKAEGRFQVLYETGLETTTATTTGWLVIPKKRISSGSIDTKYSLFKLRHTPTTLELAKNSRANKKAYGSNTQQFYTNSNGTSAYVGSAIFTPEHQYGPGQSLKFIEYNPNRTVYANYGAVSSVPNPNKLILSIP